MRKIDAPRTDSERWDWVQKHKAELGPCTLRNTRAWYVEWLPNGADASSIVVISRNPRIAVDKAIKYNNKMAKQANV